MGTQDPFLFFHVPPGHLFQLSLPGFHLGLFFPLMLFRTIRAKICSTLSAEKPVFPGRTGFPTTSAFFLFHFSPTPYLNLLPFFLTTIQRSNLFLSYPLFPIIPLPLNFSKTVLFLILRKGKSRTRISFSRFPAILIPITWPDKLLL